MPGNHLSGGQNRKPNQLHSLHGTGRVDRGTKVVTINANVQPAEKVDVPPQDWLLDAEINLSKKDFISEISDYLNKTGMANQAYSHTISLLADTYENYIKIRQVVQTQGIEAKIDRFLAVKLLDDIRKSLRAQMYEFGLTPSAASAINSKESYNENPLDGILKGFK